MLQRANGLAAALLFGSSLAQDLFVPTDQPAGRLLREATKDSNGFEMRTYTAPSGGEEPEGPGGRRLHWMFTNSFAVDTADFPDLCAPNIVQDACQLLNGDPEGAVPDTVDPDKVRESVLATREGIQDFWELIGLPVPARCSDICEAVKAWLDQHGHKVPPKSDLGCRKDFDSPGQEYVCDLDLRPEAVHESGEEGDGPGPLEPSQDAPDMLDENGAQVPPAAGDEGDEEPADDGDNEFDLSMTDIAFDVAQTFRIYPPVETGGDVQEDPLDDDAGGATAALRGSYESVRRLSNESAGRRLIGMTFGSKVAIAQNKAVAYIATAAREFSRRNTKRHMDKWFGTHAYSSPSARMQVQRVMLSVKSMLSNVEFVYPGPQCSPRTYAYVYPRGYTCSTFELKTRPCTKTHGGKFVFYMCPLTMKSQIGEQIETLTHEGSHHATAFTDDVCMDYSNPCREVAYGRSTCQRLARTSPSKALKNADSFCYYIQDITDVSHR